MDQPRSEVVGVYEMVWSCEYCSTAKLLARTHRYCPVCGAPQDPNRRAFPPPGEEQAVNVEYDGVDVRCPACATPSGARAKHCRHCGSPLEGGAAVARLADRGPPPPVQVAAPRPVQSTAAPKRWSLLRWLSLLVVLGLVGVCGWALLATREVTVTVAGHAWERRIAVERLQPVPDSAWCESLPADAYAVRRSREQRSTQRVADGEECSTRDVDRGDGTFERRRECRTRYRDEPVMGDRCHFTVDRYRTSREAVAQGRGLSPAPAWPQVGLSAGEREGPRTERYTVELRGDDGESYRCTLPEARWSRVSAGTRAPVRVGVVTGAASCQGL